MKERADFKTRGFTFTELLVVVSIGTMLVGAMLPALNTAQDTMKAAVCLGNMHQWGMAISLYVADQRDYYPYDGNNLSPCDPANTNAWYNVLTPYINQPKLCDLYTAGTPPTPRTKSIWICPSAVNTTVTPTLASPYFMYGLSTCLHEEAFTSNGFRRSRMVKPATTIIFCEVTEDNFGETNGQYVPARHFGGGNFVMGDSHAEWIAFTNFCRNGNAGCPAPLGNIPWDDSSTGGDWAKSVTYHWWLAPYISTSNQ